MKYTTLALLLACTCTAYAQKKVPAKAPVKVVNTPLLAKETDSVSYAFGMDIGRSLHSVGITTLNERVVAKAIADALKQAEPLLTSAQKDALIQKAITDIQQARQAEVAKKEEAFFKENALRPGVLTLPEGVQYEVLTATQGPKPTVDDEVKVHYKGALLDGTVFDSSYDRNQPIDLRLGQVIEGWKIAVPHMNVGAKYKIYIPSSLGYGARATGKIPANSILVFELELLAINAANEK